MTVVAGQTTPNINFGMSMGGKISGYVKDEEGNPIGNMSVAVSNGSGGTTDATGYYETWSNPPGSYQVWVNPQQNNLYYVEEWYNNSPSSTGATSVPVTAGQTTPNINFFLVSSGRITGKVTRETGGTPIQGVEIILTDYATGARRTTVYTGADGTYSIDIVPGNYRILAVASAYEYEYYNNATTYGAATSVAVTAGQTRANIDFVLALGGGDDGTISFAFTLNDKDGNALSGATVEVVGANPAITTTTDANGAFTLSGIPAGNPFIIKFSKAGYLPSYSPVTIATSEHARTGLHPLRRAWGLGTPCGLLRGRSGGGWTTATTTTCMWKGRLSLRAAPSSRGRPTRCITATTAAGTAGPTRGHTANGYFLIANAPEDTVIVQAFKSGWSFDPRHSRCSPTASPGGGFTAFRQPSDLTLAAYVKDNNNAVLPSIAAQMVGNDAVTATTDGTGAYNLAGLPNNAGFYMRFSKTGYIPEYSANVLSRTGNGSYWSTGQRADPNGQFPVSAGKSTITGKVVNASDPRGGGWRRGHGAQRELSQRQRLCRSITAPMRVFARTLPPVRTATATLSSTMWMPARRSFSGRQRTDGILMIVTLVTFADAITRTSSCRPWPSRARRWKTGITPTATITPIWLSPSTAHSRAHCPTAFPSLPSPARAAM